MGHLSTTRPKMPLGSNYTHQVLVCIELDDYMAGGDDPSIDVSNKRRKTRWQDVGIGNGSDSDHPRRRKTRWQDVGIGNGSDSDHPRRFIVAPIACLVENVMIKDGMDVNQGQPMFVLVFRYPSGLSDYSERHKSRIRNNVEAINARVGIYSLEDVVWKQEDAEEIQMVGLDLEEDVRKRYETFKKFDTVWDHSDHLFSKHASLMEPPTGDFAGRILNEWMILEQQLPETIFVRGYKSRMDLLRAVIIGPQGTPYHDGVFVFDMFLMSNYPSSAPLVRYHSGGIGINPNVYACGQVDLMRFGKISGEKAMTWVPATSNILQLLMSMQAVIFDSKPYLLSTGGAPSRGSAHGEMMSLMYNERIFVKSLDRMVGTMIKPPMHFEYLVAGHFRKHVLDILRACKAYTEGLEVGCYGIGVKEEGNSSIEFRNDVVSCMKALIDAFNKIGAKGASEFLCYSEMRTPLPDPTSEKIPDCVHHSSTMVAPAFYRAVQVYVKPGSNVKAGQPLFSTED